MIEHQSTDADSQPNVRYEVKDISYKGLVWSVVGLGVLAVGAHVGVLWLYGVLYERNVDVVQRGATVPIDRPSTPDLTDGNPALELYRLRQHEDALLNAPVARVPGHDDVVRIPVERAMQLVLEEGLEGGQLEERSAPAGGSAGPESESALGVESEPADSAPSGNSPQDNGAASEDSV